MIFYILYKFQFPWNSLENAVSEHLEWLEFQNFSGDFAPKKTYSRAYSTSQTPVVLMTAYGSAKIRYP